MERKSYESKMDTMKTNDADKWMKYLQESGATEDIPDSFLQSPESLRKLAFAYTRVSNQESRHNDYVKLAEQAYNEILAMDGLHDDLQAMRGLAYLYYKEYNYYGLWLKRNKGHMLYPKDDCEKSAVRLYEQIIRAGGNTCDYYRYAYLLYNSSSSFSPTAEFSSILDKKKKAYDLYRSAVQSYEDANDEMKESLYHIFIKACYGLSRCGLELICSRSKMLDELVVLFHFKAPYYGNRSEDIQRFREIENCMEFVRKAENLPSEIDDVESIAVGSHSIEKSWDIYYMLGKMYDCAFQYDLMDDTETAYELANKYYTYACEIDYLRRKQKLPVSRFTHMYVALFNLYLRNRKETEFYHAWNKYNTLIRFTMLDKMIFQARWKIAKRDYTSAESILMDCRNESGGHNFMYKKVELLLDLIHIVRNGCNDEYSRKYKPYQMRQLYNLWMQINEM